MINLQCALKMGVDALKDASDSARIDAEILLCHVLASNRTFIYTYPEANLTSEQLSLYEELINLRKKGFPIAYITKKREFWSLKLEVSEATLIPRADTELLIEKTTDLVDQNICANILELGTGSGAIALALGSLCKQWHILAVDNQEAALLVAKRNKSQLNLDNVTFILSDWFSNIGLQKFHAIVSNPPYLAIDDPHLSQGDLRFEPKSALVSGIDGLESLNYIIQHGREYLIDNGILLVEHGAKQSNLVYELFKTYGYQDIHCWQDLQGLDRVCSGRWNGVKT